VPGADRNYKRKVFASGLGPSQQPLSLYIYIYIATREMVCVLFSAILPLHQPSPDGVCLVNFVVGRVVTISTELRTATIRYWVYVLLYVRIGTWVYIIIVIPIEIGSIDV